MILTGHVMNVAIAGLYLTFESLSPFVYGVRMLHGVAETMLYTSLFAYAVDQVPAARTAQGLALFGVSAQLSITVGGILGDVVIHWGGYPALFLSSLSFAAIGLLLPSLCPNPVAGAPLPNPHALFVPRCCNAISPRFGP